ncbi:MAG: hypothetical protein E7450_07480 [Ruminococcaceae bacterium]|nr:hypothetical protein [Oscillospiraceae bacterium]
MYIGIDLGSTNMKAALYDRDLKCIDMRSRPVEYIRDNGFVEFEAELYYTQLLGLIGELVSTNRVTSVAHIAFTGQAESLVAVDREGRALTNVISWMDERSVDECATLADQFPAELCERITGQQAVLPTWPATKILWLKHNRPDVFANTDKFMLLKDYIVYKLTGVCQSDMSIATFTFYFNIFEKCYWQEMLDAIGITPDKLPALVEPCSVAGPLTAQAAAATGLDGSTLVNHGTLDHFAGMIGTGNTAVGGVTLSTGTVMALAAMSAEPAPRDSGIAMHYGFLPDTHVMLPVAESGGVSLEWFRRTCMGDIGYNQMNEVLLRRGGNDLLFLPYLVGTNAPEFDSAATGVFWGLRQEHDVYDMAHAVMEGVAFVLRKNTDNIRQKGTELTAIIATGGGAKSPVWCQLQADITGLDVLIPKEKEAACLGAAIIAAVADGRYADFDQAAGEVVSFVRRFTPNPTAGTETKFRRFCALYDAALKLGDLK